MNVGLLYADKPTHGRARLSRALLTLAIPPLACGFVIGLSWGALGGVLVMPGFVLRYGLNDFQTGMLGAIAPISCAVGTIIVGFVCDRFGRRRAILLSLSRSSASGAVARCR